MSRHEYHTDEGICSINRKYNSPGLFRDSSPVNFLSYDLPRIHLQLSIIFILTQSLHVFLLRPLYLPRLTSAIVVGIVIGPSVLGRLGLRNVMFPDSGDIFMNYLSRLGYIFFIFLWGVKMDARMILKAGWRGWIIGISGGIIPLLMGQLGYLGILAKTLHASMIEALGRVISSQCFISFPVVASILVELRIINTELGHLALASSLISNLIDISTSVFSTSIRHWRDEIKTPMMIQSFFLLFLYVLFIVAIVKPICYWIIKLTPKAKQVRSMYLVIVCILLLASCLLTDNIGLNHEYGALIIGLSVPDGPPLGSSLVARLETIVDGLLVPLMISYAGAKVDLDGLYDLTFLKYMYIMVGACLAAQILTVLIPALCFKVPLRDALCLSFVLSSQGIVQIAIHLFSFNSEVQCHILIYLMLAFHLESNNLLVITQMYDTETFSQMMLCVLIIASSMNTLARKSYNYSFTYAGYQKRTIQHEGMNGELRMVSCMYHFDDVYVMKKILEASIPDDKSPVSVCVMHLVELVGRANPQLIDHKVGQNAKFQSGSRSQEVFEFFTSFEHQYLGLVDVHLFTGISMFKFMHQDICGLAFKKSVSMIILPFHIKWNHQGKVISDNNNLRMVNSNVLEIAPSSVAILIDRKKPPLTTSVVDSTYRVVVIFIGGADDREALYYGNRMARSNGIHLTLVRLVAAELYPVENQWDNIMDTEALKHLKMRGGSSQIDFREEEVKDGADTTHLVHEIEQVFDLVLVGRGHNESLPQLSGLSEFTEFPELGSIGDILATSDISNPLTVLVVQQQIKKS